MNPSTSLGTRSKVGMAKPSPPVRQAGNIGHLLVIRGVCRRSLPSACTHVKYRCRCRVTGCILLQRHGCNLRTLIGSRALAAYDDVDGPSTANNRPWSRKGAAKLLRRSDARASAHGYGGTHSVQRAGAESVG